MSDTSNEETIVSNKTMVEGPNKDLSAGDEVIANSNPNAKVDNVEGSYPNPTAGPSGPKNSGNDNVMIFSGEDVKKLREMAGKNQDSQ